MQYMFSFGSSLFPIPWLYAAEILPLQVRGQGTALAVLNNWVWVRHYYSSSCSSSSSSPPPLPAPFSCSLLLSSSLSSRLCK
jgi:hypothetical protein